MALVRISEKLMDRVKANVDRVSSQSYTAQVEPLNPNSQQNLVEEMRNFVEKTVWKKHAALRNTVPESWLGKVNEIYIQVEGLGDTRIPGSLFIPPDTLLVYGALRVSLETSAVPTYIFEAMRAFVLAKQLHKEKFEKVKDQIVDFLESSRSLNDALRKFPDLQLYIPKEYLDRIEMKPEKKVNTAVPQGVEIDRDLIVAVGVMGVLQK